MYKFILPLIAGAALFGSLSAAKPYNSPYDLPENKTPTPKSLMLDQVDDTDTYAIPFDSSEVEDEIQIDRMHNTEKRLMENKPN